MDKIVVLDFGSQYSHLICRRIRDFSVYAELVPFDISLENLTKLNPKGIIFSGGPSSVYDSGAPIPDKKIFQLNVPILGICYGHQIIVNNFGGKIKRANKEYGSSVLTIDSNSDILNGIGDSVRAWMSHGDEAQDVPEGFEIIGHTESSRSAAIANKQKTVFGIQFHPEVVHTEKGTEILKNFVLDVCYANPDWTMEKFVENAVENISKVEGNVLCGVSGGIDSTVTALLIHKAIGNRLKCVFVDNGLLRLNEAEEIENMFKNNFEVSIILDDDVTLDPDTPPLKTFFVDRIIGEMKKKDIEQVESGEIKKDDIINCVINDNGSRIREIIIKNYRQEERVDEIINTATWSLTRMIENSA